MADKQFTSYGVREVQLLPMVEDTPSLTTYATELVRAYGAQEATISITTSNSQLRGDDGIIAADSLVSGVEGSVSHALISFATLKAIFGGVIEDVVDAQAAVIGEKYTLTGGQSLPYFGFAAKTVGENTLKVVAFKAKVSGNLEFSFADENYCVVSLAFTGVKRLSDDKLVAMTRTNTDLPIVAADFE